MAGMYEETITHWEINWSGIALIAGCAFAATLVAAAIVAVSVAVFRK